MARGADRNRRQAAKAANRRKVVAEKRKAELFANSLAGRVAAAAQGPLERCARHEALFEDGLGTVVIARRTPSGLIAAGFFLVDVWCLGVKDAVFKESSLSDFEEQMADFAAAGRLVDVDPTCARKLVAGAVAFASASTFQPAKHYAVVQRLFGDSAATDCAETFVYGRNGLPTYVERPADSNSRVREVIATLERVHGPKGWDVMSDMSLGSPLGQVRALLDVLRDDPRFAGVQRTLEEDSGTDVARSADEPDRGASPKSGADDDESGR